MKKIISLLAVLAILLTCAAASADLASAKTADGKTERNIQFQVTGDNPWPTDGTSPTTGRSLDQLAADYFEDGIGGMVVTGEYYPIMVQHCGYAGGVNQGAPFYGTYADVYYELAKSGTGHTRMAMIYNDLLPKYAGASRSTRVGYIWVRQEWNAPYFFAGKQESSAEGSNLITNVNDVITQLGLPYSGDNNTPWEQKVIFDGLAGSKRWLAYKYRLSNLSDACNVLWDLPGAVNGLLGQRSFEDHNHTWRFGALPEGGEDAGTVYVLFKDTQATQVDSEGIFYFNSMYQYEPDENVYYRYMISDMDNPENNPVLFEEQVLSNETVKDQGNNGIQSGYSMKATLDKGNPITFANVIVQYIDMKWPGNEFPYPILLGSGNADYFMGGKRYTGVWNRATYDDRTVFYGENGEEINLQPGRTFIILMDINTEHRAVKYE